MTRDCLSLAPLELEAGTLLVGRSHRSHQEQGDCELYIITAAPQLPIFAKLSRSRMVSLAPSVLSPLFTGDNTTNVKAFNVKRQSFRIERFSHDLLDRV